MTSKINSFDDKVKLPVTETISRFYQPQQNRKAIRILTVAVYVLCVSLAAIMLSLYYIFIWDPTVKPFMPKVSNCDKIIIPEQIAIRLTNYTEISADQFYKNILQHYQKTQRKNLRRINSYAMTSSSLKRYNNKIENSLLSKQTITTAASTSKLDNPLKSTIKSTIPATTTTTTTTMIPTTTTTTKIINHMINSEKINNVLLEQPILSSSSLTKMNRIPKSSTRRHKLSEYFIKSIKMHNNRRMNNDDEDYLDEFDDTNKNIEEASGGGGVGGDGDGVVYEDDNNNNNNYNNYENNKFIDIS